jgi:integrase
MANVRAPLTGTKRPDGRWQIILTLTKGDGTKQRKTLTAKTQREVQAKAREFLSKYGRKATDPHKMEALLEACNRDRWAGLDADTITQYNWAAKRIITFFGSLADVREIDPPMVARWLQVVKGQVSGRGVQIHRRVLSLMCGYAVETGWMDRNPVPDVRLPVSAKPTERRRLTYNEAKAIIEAEENPERRLYWWLLMETALRPQEAALLTKASVLYSQDQWWVIGGMKTAAGKDRWVMISDALGKALYDLPTEGVLFPVMTFTTPGQRRNASRRWENACKNGGVPYTNLYQLRKLRIALWKAAGVPDEVVTKMAGHTNIALTNAVYDDVTRERIRDAFQGR